MERAGVVSSVLKDQSATFMSLTSSHLASRKDLDFPQSYQHELHPLVKGWETGHLDGKQQNFRGTVASEVLLVTVDSPLSAHGVQSRIEDFRDFAVSPPHYCAGSWPMLQWHRVRDGHQDHG